MNGTNFPGHNVKHAGCDPVVTTQHTTPTKCQAACDADRACDMWTFVSTAHKSPPGAGAPPWCCLKACDGACPEPEAEAGCVSGAKDPAKYNRPPPPAPPPAPCVGADCFTFTADWASGSAATTLTTGNFSVRKTEFMYYPPDGRTYAYCDIVNFTDFCEPKPPPHHHHPATHKPALWALVRATLAHTASCWAHNPGRLPRLLQLRGRGLQLTRRQERLAIPRYHHPSR